VDIKAFVRELLFSHDCVIIPGFGGFIGNYSPARHDRVTGLFHPPVKRISFNVNLSHNDGLLISRISQSGGINYGDSKRLVEEFSADLNRKISRGEQVVFDHIGRIFPNGENRLQFEPETDINYLPGSFGLETFQCQPLSGYDVRKRVVRHIDRDPVRQGQVRRALWRAAVVIPILALLVAVPLKTGMLRDKLESSSLNPLVTAEFENNKKAVDDAVSLNPITQQAGIRIDSVTPDSGSANPSDGGTPTVITADSNNESPANTVINPAATGNPVVKPAVNEPAAVTAKGGYVIITGSFKSEENALSHINALKAEGFSPELVKAANGYFRVYAMKCTDLKTAQFRKDSLSRKFPDTWITKYQTTL